MKALNNDNVSYLIENLYLLIKYTASGFIAVGVYMFLDHLKIADLGKEPIYIILLALGIGILIYSIHFAAPDKHFYGAAVCKCLNEYKKLPEGIKAQVSSIDFSNLVKNNKKEILFILHSQTYLRHISKEPQVKQIQVLLEKRLAFLNFMYCSFYTAIILPVIFIAKGCIYERLAFADLPLRFAREIIILALGIIIFFCAKGFNRRICKREIWAISNFSQEIKQPVPADSSVTATSLTSLLDQLITKTGKMNEVVKQLKKDV